MCRKLLRKNPARLSSFPFVQSSGVLWDRPRLNSLMGTIQPNGLWPNLVHCADNMLIVAKKEAKIRTGQDNNS